MKKEIHIIGDLKPFTHHQILDIKTQIGFDLPSSYYDFLNTFGFGGFFNDFLIFDEYDTDYLKNNFSDMLDYWEWQNIDVQDVLNGCKIAHNIDGDVVFITKNPAIPFVVLLRSGGLPLVFHHLSDILDNDIKNFKFPLMIFQSFYDRKDEFIQIDFEKFLKLKSSILTFIEQKLPVQKLYEIDDSHVIYEIKSIGGVIKVSYFGHVHFSYQDKYNNHAKALIDLFQNKLDNLLSC